MALVGSSPSPLVGNIISGAAVLFTAVTLLGGYITVVVGPMREDIAALKAGKVNTDLFLASNVAITDQIRALIATDKSAAEEVIHQLHKLEDNITPTDVNKTHWDQTTALELRVNTLEGRACK